MRMMITIMYLMEVTTLGFFKIPIVFFKVSLGNFMIVLQVFYIKMSLGGGCVQVDISKWMCIVDRTKGVSLAPLLKGL